MKKAILIALLTICVLTASASDTAWVHYKGTYLFPQGSRVPSVDVDIADTVLMIHSTIGSSVLTKMGKDTFYLVAYDGMVYFLRDSINVVNAIKIEAQGELLEGIKIINEEAPATPANYGEAGTKSFLRKDE